jgi:hypothetical protein
MKPTLARRLCLIRIVEWKAEADMTRLFEEMFQRPWEAVASTMRMLSKQAPNMIKIDAIISRATHALNRALTTGVDEVNLHSRR